MTKLLHGRHNESSLSPLWGCSFFAGCALCVCVLDGAATDILRLSPEYWQAFWDNQTSVLTGSLCLIPVLLPLLFRRLGGFGAAAQLLLFFLQGALFGFCSCILFLNHTDIGVFLALFSVMVPAFFLLFSQHLCIAPVSHGFVQAGFLLIGTSLTYAARCIGYTVAADIFFSL